MKARECYHRKAKSPRSFGACWAILGCVAYNRRPEA